MIAVVVMCVSFISFAVGLSVGRADAIISNVQRVQGRL